MLKLYKGLKRYAGSLLLIVVLLIAQAVDAVSAQYDGGHHRPGVVEGNTRFIVQAGLWMLLIAVGGSAAAIGVGYLSAKVGVGFCTDVRKRLFRHIDTFTLSEFDDLGTSSLVTRSTNDVLQLQNFTVMLFRIIVLSPIMCIGGIVMALEQNAEMGLVILVCMVVVLVVLP